MIRGLPSLIAAATLLIGSVTSASLTAHASAVQRGDSSALSTTVPPTETASARWTLTTYRGGGSVVEEALYARTLDVHTSYRVFLPAGYDESTRAYPVLYMLHGVAGDSSEWQSIGLLEAADSLIHQGKIDPFLIVLPNGGANYWVNHADGMRWRDYVVRDVVPQVDRDFRTIQSPRARAIGGLSMGGEGALAIAMTYPGIFGTAAAHSPSLRTAFDQFSPELQDMYGDAGAWRAATPLWLVLDSDTAYGLNLAVDVGEDDPWRQNVTLLHNRMLQRGIQHRFEVLPGEHAAEYWIENVEHYLVFYGSALSARAVIPPLPDQS